MLIGRDAAPEFGYSLRRYILCRHNRGNVFYKFDIFCGLGEVFDAAQKFRLKNISVWPLKAEQYHRVAAKRVVYVF
jgi:hypothetical protein